MPGGAPRLPNACPELFAFTDATSNDGPGVWATAVWLASQETAAVAILLVEGHGQSAFDVASIKRNTSGEAGAGLDISRGQLRATNAPVLPVIRQAFEVMDTQVVGVTDWVATERLRHPGQGARGDHDR